MGLSDFNARRKAENFDESNFEQCVKRAHFFGVKVYVTLNTLVRDCEMEDAMRLVAFAYNAGADAFIVQDIGLASLMKSAFPDIVLHASTQLGVHNLYGARQAEKSGFERVVLARETKLEDIRAIREGTNLEIEYFVQGALCVAFSGNCYLSAEECNASGNRGLCKQLCRLPYIAQAGGKTSCGYMLSAKDLRLANEIKQLIDAGVCSFKIEGRMRREGYVGVATSVYRRILDSIASGDGAKLSADEEFKLKTAFSRGNDYLTRAYLDDGTPKVIERNFNNHTGVEIGVVKSVAPFKKDLYEVKISSLRPVQKGDGLKFFDNGKEVASVGAGDIKASGKNEYVFVTKTALKAGWKVNLISSISLDEEVKRAARKVNAKVFVRALIGSPLYIKASCEGCEAEAYGEICAKANSAPLDEAALLEQVRKTGDSGFFVSEAEAETDGVFIAKSQFNALRREVFAALKQKKESREIAKYPDFKMPSAVGIDARDYPKMRFYRDGDNEIFQVADVRKKEIPVLCPKEYTSNEVNDMMRKLGLEAGEVALQLPIILNGKDCIVLEKLLADIPQIKTLISENIYGMEFADRGYSVIAGAGHNALNGYACDEYKRLGACAVLPSIESGARAGLAGEEIPLMTFAHCPYKTVFDNDCKNCAYAGDMTLSREKHKYRVTRTKLHNCYFNLFKI